MKLITFLVIIFLLSIFNISFGADQTGGQNLFGDNPPSLPTTNNILGCSTNDTLAQCIGKAATTILQYLIFFAIILAAVFLVWAGIEYIFKGGGGKEGEGAKGKIINAVIGLVIALAAWMIVFAIKKTILSQS